MTHRIEVEGKVEKIVKRGGEGFAVVSDPHSYIQFLIPNNRYFQKQTVRFRGQITVVEKGTGYVRLMGEALPPSDYRG